MPSCLRSRHCFGLFFYDSCPWHGAPYVDGPEGEERLLCCAIADRAGAIGDARGARPMRSERDGWGEPALVVHGGRGVGGGTAGQLAWLGHLIGVPEGPYARCELRRSGSQALALSAQVKVLYPPTGHRGEALLRFTTFSPSTCESATFSPRRATTASTASSGEGAEDLVLANSLTCSTRHARDR